VRSIGLVLINPYTTGTVEKHGNCVGDNKTVEVVIKKGSVTKVIVSLILNKYEVFSKVVNGILDDRHVTQKQ